MQPIAQDTSPAGMARANEENLEAFWRYMVAQCGGELSDAPDLVLFATGISLAYFNGVCRASLHPHDADDGIAHVARWLAQRSLPGTWVVGPSTRPANLGERLLAHGFALGGEMAGMALDLRTLSDALPLSDGVTIERVLTSDQMRRWTETSLTGFGMPAAMMEPVATILARANPNDADQARYYLARLNGDPIGTSFLFIGAGVAGIYSVATLPEARQRGIGRALTVAALEDARALGYRIAILQASAMGAPIYRRLGFAEYQSFFDFVWEPR